MHVEAIAQDPVGETEWLQGLADEHGFPHGAVVRASLHQPDVERELERQCQFSIVRGVRDILNWHKNPSVSYIERSDLLTDPAWLRGFALLKKYNLSFDMQLYPLQMMDAAAVARRHPDMSIILNHAGMPVDRDPESLDHWRKGMRALAACDNVTVKISGLGMVDWNWTTESIRPFVLETIDIFGVDRSMFASNFPVDKIYSDFATLYRAFFEITKDFSPTRRPGCSTTTPSGSIESDPGVLVIRDHSRGRCMPTITRVEIFQVDLPAKVARSDAIQAFNKQETPIVRVWTDDGAVGSGYSYTIGTGGSAVVAMLRDYMAPWLIGRDAAMIEEIWKGLFFYTHANSVGATVSLALSAIDTALWDLRCKRAGAPLHVVAGGAQSRIPIYNTEGGWLNFTVQELIDHALKAREAGFRGFKVKVGLPHAAEDASRLAAVRDAVGSEHGNHGRRQPVLHRLGSDQAREAL